MEKQSRHKETSAKALKWERAWVGEQLEKNRVALTKMVVTGRELDMWLKGRLELGFENPAGKNKEWESSGSILAL